MHIAPGGLQLKTCFYSTSYINIISKLCCFVLNFAGITTALWHCSLVLCKENPSLFSQPDTGQTVQGFSRLAPCNSEPLLHYYSYAPTTFPDAPHQGHLPIRKSMYPSPPLSTRTFFSFWPSVSVAAVLGFSEGLSNTLPFRVARTLPRRGQRCCRCFCSAPTQFTCTQTHCAGQFFLLVTSGSLSSLNTDVWTTGSAGHSLDPSLLQTSSSPCYKRDGGTSPYWGRAVHILTRHRDEELDSITVTMEAELCLSHGAVGNEATGQFVTAVITIYMDDPTGTTALSRGWWSLVGWRQGAGTPSVIALSPLYRRDSIKEKTDKLWRKTFKGAGLFKGLLWMMWWTRPHQITQSFS